MSHPAFEKASSLSGRSHHEWAELAEQAEKNNNWNLAITYWKNAANTVLSITKASNYNNRRKLAEKKL